MEEKIKNIDDLKKYILENKTYKFKIKVTAGAKVEKIEFLDDLIKIKIKEKPIEGKANKAITEYLSILLNIPKSKIEIISGKTSSNKIVKVST